MIKCESKSPYRVYGDLLKMLYLMMIDITAK